MKSHSVSQVRWRFVHLVTLFMCLCLTGFFISSAHAAAKRGGKPELKIIGPLDKAWVTKNPVSLAGSITGVDVKSVIVKGVSAPNKGVVPVEGGGFGVPITLKKGANTIEVAAGKLRTKITVFFGNEKSKPKGFKRYYIHAGMKEMKCKECHKFRRGKYDFT